MGKSMSNALVIRCLNGRLPAGWLRAMDSKTIFSSAYLRGKFTAQPLFRAQRSFVIPSDST